MAGIVAVSVSLWMLTGLLGGSDTSSSVEKVSAGTPTGHTQTQRVAVQVSEATIMTREIVVSGRTEPNRKVELRAETEGKVVNLGAERGAIVRTGEKIVELDNRDRNARLEEARANIAQMKLKLEGAMKLKGQQFVSDTQIAEANADLEKAKADLKAIELEIDHTRLMAPFDAVMQERMVELGDYVNSGDTIASLVDTDPLIVVGEINERDIGRVEVGGVGRARLVTGEIVNGIVRYIAPIANENTRTFRVELAIPNPDGAMRAGMTAEMRLAGEKSSVHFFSPALLALDDDGVIGVKTVDDEDRVRFYPVEIIDSNDSGISVSGLPDEVRLIVVGQGFVKTGDRVIPVTSPAPAGLSNVKSDGQPVAEAAAAVPQG